MPSKYPIGIRARNRVGYLDITLRSLMATNLPKDQDIVVLDDCSDDEDTQKYLFTSDEITLENPVVFKQDQEWKKFVGDLPGVSKVVGIKDKFPVVQPETKKGVRGGVFWCVDKMMEMFPEANAVIIIEADVVFHRDWYTESVKAYLRMRNTKGPMGESLGILSAYNRKPGAVKDGETINCGWRTLSRKPGNPTKWNCGNGLGGVMLLVTRPFYSKAIDGFKVEHKPELRSGDTAIQALCAMNEFNIANISPSLIQHIGIDSTAWPDKGWRLAKRFKKPFVIKEKL